MNTATHQPSLPEPGILSPCPCCGSEAALGVRYSRMGWGTFAPTHYHVGCKKCGLRTSEALKITEAAEVWNTRAALLKPDLRDKLVHVIAGFCAQDVPTAQAQGITGSLIAEELVDRIEAALLATAV